MANSNLEVEVTCGLNVDVQSADFALKMVTELKKTHCLIE